MKKLQRKMNLAEWDGKVRLWMTLVFRSEMENVCGDTQRDIWRRWIQHAIFQQAVLTAFACGEMRSACFRWLAMTLTTLIGQCDMIYEQRNWF